MFKTGFIEGSAADAERSNWSGDGPRPLTWAAWYPAEDAAVEEPGFIGPPDQPLFVMGPLARGARLSESAKRWPVVLVSHGTGGTATGLGWLGCRLAAAGIVAIGVNHHGNTAIEPCRAEGFLCWWERARDLSVILDQLASGGIFAGRLDLSRVYAAGFSLGGYSVLALAGAITDLTLFEEWSSRQGGMRGPREFPDLGDHATRLLATSAQFRDSQARHGRSYRDPRLKAALALAPAPPVRGFTPDSLASITLPVRIMVGQSDAEAPADGCAAWLASHLPNCELTRLGREVGHYVFLCEATETGRRMMPAVSVDATGVDRGAIHQRVADVAIRLFRSQV
jgi:predicted dienelactone hydrolase